MLAAECLQELFRGPGGADLEGESIASRRARVGALLVGDAFDELRILRKMIGALAGAKG